MAILTERRIENMKRIILSCLSLLMLFSMLTPWKTSAKSKSKLNKTSITMYTGRVGICVCRPMRVPQYG